MDNSAIEDVGEPRRYVKRALAGTVARSTAPVAILEGAHAVGKTALVKNEKAFEGFHYVTLADEETFAQVRRRPRQWAMALPRPVVIDEVHRVPSLVSTIRRLAPKRPADRPEFVLVTSQALLEEEMAAPKPARFTLYPLTQAELCGRSGCIIDDLFDGDVAQRFCSAHTRSDLRTMMRVGGFPARAMRPVSALSRRHPGSLLQQMGLRTASESASEQEADIDQLIGRAILERLLTNPGISLGVDAIAAACSVDAETLTAYLAMLQDRFLIHRLTMLDKKKQPSTSFAKTRLYPVDAVFAVEALQRAGRDITVEPPVFAKALRTLCLDQLIPAVQWANVPTECFHWKKFEHRMREVDLVFKREERLVGITIRNSMAARHDTVGALRLLAKDERFARGFIIYMGATPRRLAENIWAIPVSALWEPEAFFPGLTNLQS